MAAISRYCESPRFSGGWEGTAAVPVDSRTLVAVNCTVTRRTARTGGHGTMPMTAAPLVEAERNDRADFLETLTPQQWAAPSLCEQWTMRDVVAHVVSYEGAGAAELARRFADGRHAKPHQRRLA